MWLIGLNVCLVADYRWCNINETVALHELAGDLDIETKLLYEFKLEGLGHGEGRRLPPKAGFAALEPG